MVNEDCAAAVARRVGWLSRTPPSFQEAVIAGSVLRHYRQGQTICCLGGEPGGLVGAIRGSIEIHFPGHGGDSTLGFAAGAGFWSVASEEAAGEDARVCIRAGRDCWVSSVSRAVLQDIATTVPATWRHVSRLLAASQTMAFGLVEVLRRTDPVQRVAATILILAKGYYQDPDIISISQSDIASISRLSRSFVNTAISVLQAKGLVAASYGALELTDVEGLACLVRSG
jgi:CRP/FNR family transcriptional regulator, cyclic AMP receptor protein